MFDLVVNRPRSTQGHYLNNLSSTPVPNATYQISRQNNPPVQEKRFVKVFTVNRHGGHVGHVTWTI